MFNYIDHIVYAVTDLAIAVEDFSNRTGLKVVQGGQHLDQGTHNALVRIDEKTYLEFIAKDPTIPSPASGTWMGLDLIKENKITRWSLGSSRIVAEAKMLSDFNGALGIVEEGRRAKSDGSTLKWKMTNVLASPTVDVVPFLLDWGNSAHPTEGITKAGAIIDFKIYTNQKAELARLYDTLHLNLIIEESDTPKMELVLGTPKGQVTLT